MLLSFYFSFCHTGLPPPPAPGSLRPGPLPTVNYINMDMGRLHCFWIPLSNSKGAVGLQAAGLPPLPSAALQAEPCGAHGCVPSPRLGLRGWTACHVNT